MHHGGGSRHAGAHRLAATREAASRRGRAVPVRSSARLRHLSGGRSLRAAVGGGGPRHPRISLRRRRSHAARVVARHQQPLLRFRSRPVHRLLAVCARLQRGAGHARAHHRGPRLRIAGRGEPARTVPRVRVRLVRRVRRVVPDRRADREVARCDGRAGACGDDHLRILRGRLLVQGGDQRRRRRTHGAESRRRGEPRPCLREGPFRLWLRDASGPRPEAHDPRADHRPLARSLLGGCYRARGERIPAHPGCLRAGLGRRHHLVALHERGNLPGAEAGARRTWHQQRRYLRAGVSLADRVWLEEHARRVRGHAGVRLGDEGGRDRRDRRQPDRRASGLRLADEAPSAPGRPADRDRPARDRPGALRTYRGHRTPAVAPWHERGVDQCAGARRGHRRPHRRRLRRGALRGRLLPALEGFRRRGQALAGGDRSDHGRAGSAGARGGPDLRGRSQQRDLLRARRHRAQPGHDHGDGHRQPRDGHRQPRSRRCRRQSAARPEQRAGLVRHGIVPARVQRLPSRVGRRGAWPVRGRMEGPAGERARPADPEHVRSRARRQLSRPLRAGRGLRPVRSGHEARRRGNDAPWSASSCRTCS